MTKLLRLLAAPLVAAVTLLAAVATPAHADEPPSDADLARQWQEAWDTHKFYLNIPPAPGSGKSRAHRSISIDINAPIGRVFDAYSDFTNHIGRAAFLKRVVTHKTWKHLGVRYNNLTAVEEVPYDGQLVTLYTHTQQRIHRALFFYETDTYSEPGVITHQKIVFTKLGPNKTRVTEFLTFAADSTRDAYVAANGVTAPQQTLAALKPTIESGEL